MKGHAIGWLPEELDWIRAHADWPRDTLTSAFNFRFGRSVTRAAINSLCKRNGWKGQETRFQKGQPSWIKGKPTPWHPNSAAARFKPGQRPLNKLNVGQESIDRDGYVKICVAEPNPWTGAPTHMAFKHRWLWEKANGPVPEGHVLKCLDGNRQNCAPENWIAVPRGVLPRLNGLWVQPYDTAPPEVKPALLATAHLAHAVHRIRKEGRK